MNVRGIKPNSDYICKLLKRLDICAISEHWLHDFDLHLLQSLHKDFNALSSCTLPEEDPITCTPRYIRGNGGVAILWRRCFDGLVKRLHKFSNERMVAIQVSTFPRPTCLLSVYLPSQSGCTDSFKDYLDYIDAVIDQLTLDNDVLVLGDLNADPGPLGGPRATTKTNEQGRILMHYLRRWNCLCTLASAL